MNRKEFLKNSDDSTSKAKEAPGFRGPVPSEQMDSILKLLPEKAREELSGPLRSGDSRQLLVTLRTLRGQLDLLIESLEKKYG